MRSPNLLQIGIDTDIPNKKQATIQPIYWIPCKSDTIAGIAVLIIVASNPAIILAKISAQVIIVICLLFIQSFLYSYTYPYN